MMARMNYADYYNQVGRELLRPNFLRLTGKMEYQMDGRASGDCQTFRKIEYLSYSFEEKQKLFIVVQLFFLRREGK